MDKFWVHSFFSAPSWSFSLPWVIALSFGVMKTKKTCEQLDMISLRSTSNDSFQRELLRICTRFSAETCVWRIRYEMRGPRDDPIRRRWSEDGPSQGRLRIRGGSLLLHGRKEQCDRCVETLRYWPSEQVSFFFSVGLLKKKTAWYVLCRAIREKAAHISSEFRKNPSTFSKNDKIRKIFTR